MKKTIKTWSLSVIAAALLITGCGKNESSTNSPDLLPNTIILNWNETAYEAFGGKAYVHSPMASRINAMMHLAIHDGLNGIQEKYERYAFQGNDAGANPFATVAAAAHTVLLAEIPDKKGFLDSALASAIADVKDTAARNRGLLLGKAAGEAVLQKRGNDGNAGELLVPIAPSTTPGVYQGVPPFNMLFAPHWQDVQLFSLQAKDQFRPAPYPALNTASYAADFNEVKSVGKINSTERTEAQTAYAKFWYEFSEAGWNRVARNAAVAGKLGLMQTARLFALVDMAMADAYIAGWDAKIHYNFWRPYTAIREAANDGNDATLADIAWEPGETTPPVQDYPSTHSALGNAAATVLAAILGDQFSFTLSSPTAIVGSAPRNFNSFSAAAIENADSRVMAGIHFRFSCDAGLELGRKIGEWTVQQHLKPIQ